MKKKKKDDLPKDSLFILNLKTDKLESYANLISVDLAKEERNRMAFLFEDLFFRKKKEISTLI